MRISNAQTTSVGVAAGGFKVAFSFANPFFCRLAGKYLRSHDVIPVNGKLRSSFPAMQSRQMPHYGSIARRNSMNSFASRFTLLALALSAVSLASVTFAQDSSSSTGSSSAPPSAQPMHQAPDPQKQVARLTKRLGLSDDQSSKLLTIIQNRQQQMEAIRGDSSLSQQDRHSKMRSLQQDSDSQINAVLTPAQQTQYANMKQMQKQRMQNGHGQDSSSGDSNGGSNNGNSSGN
jgi:Spy/CpxP family protein refolding chaperone